MKDSQIAGVLTPILDQFGLELEAVEVIPAGKRRLLRVVVDGDGPDGRGPVLDEIAEASKALSAALDSSDAVGTAAYTLEVSSRGVGRPLELPRHWRRNVGRLVAVTLTDGDAITGRIVGSDARDRATRGRWIGPRAGPRHGEQGVGAGRAESAEEQNRD